MIKNIDISARNFELNDKTRRYIKSKIGRLDRYMPRRNRKNVRAEVKLIENRRSSNEKYTFETVLHIGRNQLTAKESTINMYAAIDIVEAKLKNQLRKFKEKHLQHRKADRKGIFSRLRRLADRDYWGGQN